MAVVVAVGLSFAGPSGAEEEGWYAGGGGSVTDYKGPDVIRDLSGQGLAGTSALKTQAFPWQLFFGYRGVHHLGFEAGYLHLDALEGKLDLTAPVINRVDGSRETDGFSLLIDGSLPVRRGFTLVANGGVYIWHIHSAASSLASATAVAAVNDHRGVAPRVGFGLEANISERSTLRVQWNIMRLHHETTHLYSIDFVHYFGKGPAPNRAR